MPFFQTIRRKIDTPRGLGFSLISCAWCRLRALLRVDHHHRHRHRRHVGEAASIVNMVLIMSYVCAAWLVYYDFITDSIVFFLMLGKLVEPVIDTGRKFQILGPWWSYYYVIRLHVHVYTFPAICRSDGILWFSCGFHLSSQFGIVV